MNTTDTYRQTAQEMLTFIEKSPSCYHAIANIKETLSEAEQPIGFHGSLESFPGSSVKQNQYRQDLQSAKQHGKGQNDFGKTTVSGKACVGADCFKGRSHVGDTGKCR